MPLTQAFCVIFLLGASALQGLQGATNQQLKLAGLLGGTPLACICLHKEMPCIFILKLLGFLPSSYIGPPMSPRQCKMAGPIVKMVGFWLSDWSGPRRLLLEPAVTQSLLRCEAAFRFKVQEASHQRTSSFRFTLECRNSANFHLKPASLASIIRKKKIELLRL